MAGASFGPALGGDVPRVVFEHGTREGRVLAPFVTRGYDGFNVDDEEDWARAERLVADGKARLQPIDREPYAAG